MANAVATPTVTFVDYSPKTEIVFGTVAINANPATYPTGGVILDFSGIDLIKSGVVPTFVELYSMPNAGTVPSGFVYLFCPGTTIKNGKVTIFTSNGAAANPLLEFTNAGAIPAGVSGDVIQFRAVFQKLI